MLHPLAASAKGVLSLWNNDAKTNDRGKKMKISAAQLKGLKTIEAHEGQIQARTRYPELSTGIVVNGMTERKLSQLGLITTKTLPVAKPFQSIIEGGHVGMVETYEVWYLTDAGREAIR